MTTNAAPAVLVLMTQTPDAHGRFLLWIDGYMESWTLAQIKHAIANGSDLREQS